MKKEVQYEFRNKLVSVHKNGIRDSQRVPRADEVLLSDYIKIRIPENSDEVILTACDDFVHYLNVSMKICAELCSDVDCDIVVSEADEHMLDLKEANVYRGFAIEVSRNKILVCGNDSRGIAQALYYLEDVMSMERAPVLPIGTVRKHPLFSPQMVHSGYGLDDYPNGYLSRIAHEGRDAILVFTKGVNLTPGGYLDFNSLIDRAASYGIDVYAYSYLVSDMSPEAPEAEKYYDDIYGSLFRECPLLKGVVLVGESVEFPSRDLHVFPGRINQTDINGIPTGKVTSGWYPCEDYPIWLNIVKKVIRKYKSDADIVFWTYNWGYQPEEARINLIESLPDDISLQATFEMFEPKVHGNSIGKCADYTLSFEGPGKYFVSEAEAARKKGIRLYSMTNTGGLTWDIGVIPYEPMPYQWIRRYKAMRDAHYKWGLCGIMESHHYGFYPSFVSKLSKWSFWNTEDVPEEILEKIIKSEFGNENYFKVDKALRSWSEAIRYYVPSDADQYGAFRVGPSYPLCLEKRIDIPSDSTAMFGSSICCSVYNDGLNGNTTVLSIRIHDEIESLHTMKNLLEDGLKSLEACSNPNENLLELINLGKFIYNTVKTGLASKKWYVLKCKLACEKEIEALKNILLDMEKIVREEIINAEETIELVENDSRLGWEPSMLYITDRWHLEWKIRQLNYILEKEICEYKKSIKISDTQTQKKVNTICAN